jgi:hypothetical protein
MPHGETVLKLALVRLRKGMMSLRPDDRVDGIPCRLDSVSFMAYKKC